MPVRLPASHPLQVQLSQFLNAIPIIMLLLFYHGYLSPFPYMAVRAVAGSIDTMSVAMAYTADLVTAENRSAAFGMVGWPTWPPACT